MKNLPESFWGELEGKTRRAWKQFREEDSPRQLLGTAGGAGWAAAIQSGYPRVRPLRCWVHPRRNRFERVLQRGYDPGKASAQALYPARDRW